MANTKSEGIFSNKHTFAIGESHCMACNADLQGVEYIVEKGRPVCLGCWRQSVETVCDQCNNPMTDDVRIKRHGDMNIECDEVCHLSSCDRCQQQLENKVITTSGSQNVCGTGGESSDGQKCAGCNVGFQARETRRKFKGTYFHEPCFVCDSCKQQLLRGSSFYVVGGERHCQECAAEYIKPQTCAECNKSIRDVRRAIQYDGKSYHENCFLCESCHKKLESSRFTDIQGHLYCMSCRKKSLRQSMSCQCNPAAGVKGMRMLGVGMSRTMAPRSPVIRWSPGGPMQQQTNCMDRFTGVVDNLKCGDGLPQTSNLETSNGEKVEANISMDFPASPPDSSLQKSERNPQLEQHGDQPSHTSEGTKPTQPQGENDQTYYCQCSAERECSDERMETNETI